MTIQEKINGDLKNSMLNKNNEVRDLLRVVIGEFNRVDKVVSDEKALSILKKMVENAKVIGNTNEVLILETYLPKQLGENELNQILTDHINVNGYGLKDMGKIMGYLKENYSGQYDGKLASNIVKDLFSLIK